ncbi:ATF1 isoform 5 [Pongo abelii]|uniref:ATF1 isoform 5 n=1 Tax=Pongo abelii TaxID=9601 RepID=A0A2J8SY36_PONAB|nr:ATF1 isoform 5 [Pongo abelii]
MEDSHKSTTSETAPQPGSAVQGAHISHIAQQGLTLSPRLVCSSVNIAHCSLDLLCPSNPPASASQVAGTTGIFFIRK